MRHIVIFAHEKYYEIHHELRRGTPGYQLPLGLYRQVAIVVEAEDHESAVEAARKELGFPAEEMGLHAFGVASQEEVLADLLKRDPAVLPPPEGWEPGVANQSSR